MKIQISGWVYRADFNCLDQPTFGFTSCSERPSDLAQAMYKITYIQPHTFEVEVPDGDMIAERVQAIRTAKAKAREDLNRRLAELSELEEKLLALPTPEVA